MEKPQTCAPKLLPTAADATTHISAPASAVPVVLAFGNNWSSRDPSAMRRRPAHPLVLRPRRSERSKFTSSIEKCSARRFWIHDDVGLRCAFLLIQERSTLFHHPLNSKSRHEVHANSRKGGVGVLVAQVNERVCDGSFETAHLQLPLIRLYAHRMSSNVITALPSAARRDKLGGMCCGILGYKDA